jgi:hypothetical protein
MNFSPFGVVNAWADRSRSMFVANLRGVPDSVEQPR